jgi:hypothetical protein
MRIQSQTIDGLFATSIGVQKRQENNLETWVLFVDLVKAFDTVPQDALFAVLRRYGLTNPFCDIIIRHYKNATTKLKIGSIDSEIESSIGVRQFFVLVIMQAALETMKWPVPKP